MANYQGNIIAYKTGIPDNGGNSWESFCITLETVTSGRTVTAYLNIYCTYTGSAYEGFIHYADFWFNGNHCENNMFRNNGTESNTRMPGNYGSYSDKKAWQTIDTYIGGIRYRKFFTVDLASYTAGANESGISVSGRILTTERNSSFVIKAYDGIWPGLNGGDQTTVSVLSGLPTAPIVGNMSVSDISATSLKANFNPQSGGATITANKIQYSTNSDMSNAITIDGTSAIISGLSSNTTYYIRGYSTNNIGTNYTNIISATTSNVTIPTVSALTVNVVGLDSANASYTIIDTGGAEIIIKEIQFSTTNDFSNVIATISNNSGTVATLNPGTTYYVRGHASNSAGDSYTNVQTITTTQTQEPTISSFNVISVDDDSSKISFIISNNNGTVFNEEDFEVLVYDSTGTTQIQANITLEYLPVSNTGGKIVATIEGLEAETEYEIKVKAKDKYTTTTTDVGSFTTDPVPEPTDITIIWDTIEDTYAHGTISADLPSSSSIDKTTWNLVIKDAITSEVYDTIYANAQGEFSFDAVTRELPDMSYATIIPVVTNAAGEVFEGESNNSITIERNIKINGQKAKACRINGKTFNEARINGVTWKVVSMAIVSIYRL